MIPRCLAYIQMHSYFREAISESMQAANSYQATPTPSKIVEKVVIE